MSVWTGFGSSDESLVGTDGELVSVSLCVEPRLLEGFLDALAHISFPINPQIYHKAAVRYAYGDGHEDLVPTTLVEFPAYAGKLDEVKESLSRFGFSAENLYVTNMLKEIHSNSEVHPAPLGSPYASIVIHKYLASV